MLFLGVCEGNESSTGPANVKGTELKGRYIDCCQDLGELVNRIDEVKEKKLNLLKADLYPTAVFNPRDLAHLGKS